MQRVDFINAFINAAYGLLVHDVIVTLFNFNLLPSWWDKHSCGENCNYPLIIIIM